MAELQRHSQAVRITAVTTLLAARNLRETRRGDSVNERNEESSHQRTAREPAPDPRIKT
jgi:hypothetical protein